MTDNDLIMQMHQLRRRIQDATIEAQQNGLPSATVRSVLQTELQRLRREGQT